MNEQRFFIENLKVRPRDISVTPDLEKDKVRVRPSFVGICGSDLHLLKDVQNISIGHEWVGQVESVGTDVTTFTKGDVVTGSVFWGCGTCEYCQAAKENFCSKVEIFGGGLVGGAFSTQIDVKERHLVRINSSHPENWHVLLETFAVGKSCLDLAIKEGIKRNSKVLILGAGSVGLACASSFTLAGFEVTILDIRAPRVKFASESGFNSLPLGYALANNDFHKEFDLVIDASGDQSNQKGARDVVHVFGRPGFLCLFLAMYTTPYNLVGTIFSNAKIIFPRGTDHHALESNMQNIEMQMNLMKRMVSHPFQLDQFEEAIKLAHEKNEIIKVVVEIENVSN